MQDSLASPAPVSSSSARFAFVDAPPGFRRERKRYLGPIIAGGTVFGLGWVSSFLTGLLGVFVNATVGDDEPRTEWGYMFIPIAGPFVMLATKADSQDDEELNTALAIMGATQIAGASLLGLGFALGKSNRLVPATAAAPFVVQPLVGPTTAGVLVGGAF